jgi:hypothetical protein
MCFAASSSVLFCPSSHALCQRKDVLVRAGGIAALRPGHRRGFGVGQGAKSLSSDEPQWEMSDSDAQGTEQQTGGGEAVQKKREDGRVTVLKAKLSTALQGLDRGFSATQAQRKVVHDILEQLRRLSPMAEPAVRLLETTTTWQLIYSDAPDIVGGGNDGLLLPRTGAIGKEMRQDKSHSPAHPLFHPKRAGSDDFRVIEPTTGQKFDAQKRTVTNIVERIPPRLFSSAFPQDSLVLRVALAAEPAGTASPSRVSLKVCPRDHFTRAANRSGGLHSRVCHTSYPKSSPWFARVFA